MNIGKNEASFSTIAYIIGVLRPFAKKENTGYRIKSINGVTGQQNIRDIPTAEVINILMRGATLENAKLSANHTIEFTQGSMKAYPVIDSDNQTLRGKNGLTLLYAIKSDDTTLGYGVTDFTGMVSDLKVADLIKLSSRYTQTNWEVYTTQSGEKSIRMKSGTLRSVQLKKTNHVQSYNSKRQSAEEVERIRRENEEAKRKNEEAKKDKKADTLLASEVAKSVALKAKMSDLADVYLKAYEDFTEFENKKRFAEQDRCPIPNGEAILEEKRKAMNKALDEYNEAARKAYDNLIIDSGLGTELPALDVSGFAQRKPIGGVKTDISKKMTKIAGNMAMLSPYYASMYRAIPKMITTIIPTMAVTEKEMLINADFMNSLTLGEATFVYIHEMLHISLQHPARHGNRHNELWNIACDLYINELICRDFGIRYGDPHEKEFQYGSNKAVIKCPKSGIFLSTIGEELDFAVDTAERIYARLLQENPDMANNNGQQSGGQQGGQQSGQQGGQQGGQQSGGQQSGQQGSQQSGSQQGGQQSGQQGGQQSGSGQQGSNGQGTGQGTGQGNEQGTEQGNEQGTGQGNGQGNEQQNGQNGGFGDDSNSSDSGWDNAGSKADSTGGLQDEIVSSNIDDFKNKQITREVIYKGKKMAVTTNLDIAVSKEVMADRKNGNDTVWEKTRTAITRVITKRRMDEQETGKSLSMTSGTALVERSIDFALSTTRDWSAILKNIANQKPKKMHTLARPNRTYMQMGTTVASRQHLGKPTKISGIKFAVDVSGSIGEQELHRVFTKIAQILTQYELDAELIYWDTQITNAGDFKTLAQALQVKPLGFGGTDVTCVFDYLLGKTKWQGRREETKPKDISCVIIFTDGCIGSHYNTDEYRRYFGNKVVWVIDENAPPFKPLFGVVAKDKLSK